MERTKRMKKVRLACLLLYYLSIITDSNVANKRDPQAVFDIYVYDDNSGKAKMEKFVTLGSFTNVQGKNLSGHIVYPSNKP